MTTTPAAATITAAILDGRLDGHLLDINKAILTRFERGKAQTRWVIHVDDLTIDQDEVGVGVVRAAEKIAGTTWIRLNPISSADHWVAVVAASLLKAGKASSVDDAVAQAEAYPMGVVNDSVSEREVVDGPKG